MELKSRTDGDGCEVLLEDFTAHGITVPAGFRSDGASTPRPLWSIIPPFKGTKKAAFVHDWMCSIAKNAKERKAADKLFHKMLLEAGLSKARAKLGYLGVRTGAHFGVGVRYKHWTDRWT